MTAPVSGASAPVPYDLHPWNPVVYADAGAALTLPLGASGAATGVTARTGTAPALTAPLTAASAAGQAARSGVGAATTLPLTTAPGSGHAITAYFAGPGTAILLPFTTGSGLAVKRVSRTVDVQPLLLVDSPANGSSVRQGSGEPCTLVAHLSGGTGQRTAAGSALDADLRLPASRGDGRRYEWIFLTPSDQDWQPFSTVYPSVLNYGIPYASTVWQDADGEWHTARGPNPARLLGALRIYEGGRLHALSADDIAVLTAAGFAGNLTLREMH